MFRPCCPVRHWCAVATFKWFLRFFICLLLLVLLLLLLDPMLFLVSWSHRWTRLHLVRTSFVTDFTEFFLAIEMPSPPLMRSCHVSAWIALFWVSTGADSSLISVSFWHLATGSSSSPARCRVRQWRRSSFVSSVSFVRSGRHCRHRWRHCGRLSSLGLVSFIGLGPCPPPPPPKKKKKQERPMNGRLWLIAFDWSSRRRLLVFPIGRVSFVCFFFGFLFNGKENAIVCLFLFLRKRWADRCWYVCHRMPFFRFVFPLFFYCVCVCVCVCVCLLSTAASIFIVVSTRLLLPPFIVSSVVCIETAGVYLALPTFT